MMDDLTTGLDPDLLMDLEDPDGSDMDDEDEEFADEPLPSPLQLPSSGPGSTTTSITSSPPNNEDFLPPFNCSGKPLSSLKRGRGRPKRDGGKSLPRKQSVGSRGKKPRAPGASRGGLSRRFKSLDRDFEVGLGLSSEELAMLDQETAGSLLYGDKPSLPSMDDVPYAPELWPGKVCAYCNLGERSQLGQGELLRLNCPEGFIPQRMITDSPTTSTATPEKDAGDKSPRGPVTCRRQKSFNKCRHPSLTSEYIDELTIIGYSEEPHVSVLYEQSGHFYVHRNCALWSDGVVKNEHCALENVGPVVLQSSSRKCSFCNHYGASVFCKADGCSKIYHYPCATASGAFQELPTLTTYCSNHLGHAGSLCELSVCNTCKSLGDLANLTFCSSCGDHYHGTCVGLAQLPGVRAGWQCRKCRNCQVCRSTGDESKLMTCEQCDKVYHAGCQRPIVTTIPKYGWKCRCCRVCGDCGSRTPGAGLSSRWHAHYTVCDSCYQQRNKGFFCPICRRAYRAHAHREMVQCTSCNKFVHGTCDPEADLSTYNQKKEANPEYDYVCSSCKSISRSVQPITSKRNSIEDGGDSLSASQESLYDDLYDFDASCSDVSIRSLGLGKGKPYSALKLANNKKRLGYASSCSGALGRPKGSFGKGLPGKVGFIKRQRLADFGRKRGQKPKMRGMFGFPGVGLQRPTSTDGRAEEEPGGENRLVLCSASDKFALMQDVCVMCGAFGTDQEGCLIGCVQCGQCYHPYCVNVKVTKVILEKGWRCLDCTICEGCGMKTDEPRLILCDECDISYHTYCVDPPLDYVPQGTWKCNSCVMCQMCGATDPGFNCTWMNSFSECGPCASQVSCSSCNEPYIDGDIILKCTQCERWSHGGCDSIKTEEEADICVQDGYNCVLCRPRDVPPTHLIPVVSSKPPTPTKSPEVKATNYFLDGIHLSEWGHNLIKSLTSEHSTTRKKRKKLPTVQDKEAGILATIESVVAGGSCEGSTSLEDTPKLEIVDVKDEPQEQYKEGMIWTKEDGPPPDGFTVFTMESGVSVLRRKRQRNLQKMGIGGFLVRVRGNNRTGQENDDIDVLPGQTNLPCSEPGTSNMTTTGVQEGGDKPKRKPVRRKPKSKLSETFPPYLQEAFFGKDLLDSTKELASSSSDEEKSTDVDKTIHLSQEEMKAVAAISIKKEEKPSAHNIMDFRESLSRNSASKLAPLMLKEEVEENSEDIKDMFGLPKDFIDPELVNTIMNDNDELTKNAESLEALTADANLPDDADITDTLGSSGNSKDTKDELSDILGSHFNLDAISNINSKDVEDIFKGVLTDESQESQESNAFPLQSGNIFQSNIPQPVLQQHPMVQPPMRPNTLPAVQSNLNSPLSFPAQSPYQSEYSNSPQFSPAFSEANANWVSPVNNVPEPNESEVATNTKTKSGTPAPTRASNNQRSSEKMKADEGLGNLATISAVLYANVNHPEWKKEFPIWSDRYKQMIKKWRTLPNDQKTPYLQQARDNRSALRMKKQQQDQEKMSSQQKSAKEAEQERQWKHMQAMRLQQAQQQQHNIHEQRVQAIARAQSNQQFLPDLQVNTALQELSPSASPSPRQFPSLGMKSPPFQHPSVSTLRPNVPTSSHEYTSNTPDSSDPYAQQPSTPKPQTPMFQTRPTGDSFIQQQPPTRPQFSLPRSAIQSIQTRQEAPDINNHLRDLLQRQQFKKLDEQLLAGKGHQRLWPPTETQDSADIPVTSTTGSADGTFRQPLPPPGIRPRQPTALPNLPRQALIGLRMQPVQNMDNRMRMLMQQQQQVKQRLALPNNGNQVQQFPQVGGTAPVRFPMGTPGRPSSIDQFEQIIQRQQPVTSQRNIVDQTHTTSRLQLAQNQHLIAKIPVAQQQATPSLLVANASASDQEIPDNVTAELEKLEQETGTMEELHGVSDILGGLGDDDDELLAEMGADFNILEYADPELEALAGEKTNILDLELEEEPMKKEKTQTITPGPATSQVRPTSLPPVVMQQSVQQQSPVAPEVKKENVMPQLASSTVTPPTQQQPVVASSSQPPPLVLPQQNQNLVHPVQPSAAPLLQQIHQHMIQQVQQAAAQNRPMAPGSRLQTPDGVTGIVTPNNNVQLHVPPNYQRILLSQLQNQKLQMRVGQSLPRMLNPPTSNLHSSGIPMGAPRLGVPPPPPPPYPGPPPPYPGSSNGSQQQEQPLLLEDLLEQEKREQEKQIQSHNVGNQPNMGQISNSETALLSDHDFERLKADVFDNNLGLRDPAPPQQVNPSVPQNLWQHAQNQRPTPSATPAPPPAVDVQPRVQLFNINPLPAPPLPPENIITEQDKQTQMFYEQWLNNQNNILTQQLRYYETEVQKLRKSRKSLNSKQRQLKKSGNSLNEVDATELQRIQSEQSILQKHLESSRKQTRQHGMLIQEYRNKQAKQHPGQVPSPHMLNQPGQSPLGPPASSPIHHPNSSQSPMMSPSASMSPLTQHNSPLHSPGNLLSQSPGPSSVPNLLQSPSSLAGSGMSPMQPSPRIGTPQSQNDSPVHSPSQICLPPPVPRMTSPQHRRVVTSPVAYSNDLRQGATQMRFIRTPINDHSSTLQQRVVRMSSPSSYQQKPGTPSPLNSPPPSQQLNITQHILQKQLHQQALLHQQQQQGGEGGSNENPIGHFQRANQLVKQRNMLRQQQQQQHQNQQQIGQPQPLTPQQHQLMIQQQQQLAKQQQQHIAQFQAQARLNQLNNQPPKSPMPPKSPLVQQQMMSPHSMPPSPMPPRSPMMTFVNNQQHQQSQNQPPHSPIARSPSYHQGMSGQPPSSPMTQQHQSPSPVPRSPMMNQILSPMSMRRQPSTPDMPDRPMSVERPTSVERPLSIENPGTPRTPSYFMDNSQGGGGNGNNPIPAPPSCDRIGYIKLGLRGGTPMWNLGRGAKRVPTPPANNSNDKISPVSRAIKKDTIHNKVTILKKKSAVKLQTGVIGKISSLVSSDYNDLDDSSSTPPVTPPPIASTSRLSVQKKVCDAQEVKDDSQIVVLDNSAEDIMDYDDDNSTVLSTEVSLNSAAQNDADEIMETLSQSDLTDVMSSPLGSAQISDEYLLFHGNVVDIEGEEQYFDKDATEEHEYVGEDMHIVIRSPTTSDDEYIMQEKGRKYGMQTISPQLLSITETPDSPEQEEINTDPSPEPEEMDSQNYEDSQNIVLIDQSMKISKEQISTKVDFEELIDEGSRKQNLLKSSVISVSDINDFHKFTNQTYSIQQQKPSIQVIQKSVSATLPRHTIKQIPQKVSIITAPVIHNVATVSASDVKITTCLQNRSNVLTIPKLVSSVPPVITIVSASSSQMSSMLPSGFTGPVISATAVRNLTNVKVIDKPTSSLSLSHDNSLPKKIFEDDSVSPDSSNCEDDKKDSSDEKSKNESPPVEVTRRPNFPKIELQKPEPTVKIVAIEHTSALKRRDVSIMQSEGKEMMSTHTATENLIDTKEHQKKVMENVMAEKRKKVPSPIISKTLSTAIIHNTPELKMTAQVIQESQPSIQISGRSGNDSYELSSSEDTKSVVISIPSPTPSQEQMLDNITLQAIEKRRRDGKGIPSGFESFEDVLDMIENITGEPPTVLEDNIKDKIQDTNVEIKSKPESAREKILSNNKREMSMSIAASTMSNIKASTMPQLSPLSQPTDLTTNMANASQQLRTLLSLHTSSSSSSTELIAKSELHKPTSSVIISAAPVVTSRIIQHIGKPTSTTSSTVIVPNVKTSPISSVINNVIKSSASSPAFSTISNSQSHNLATGALTTQRSISSFHLIPDISKSTSATSVSGFTTNSSLSSGTLQKTSVISSTPSQSDSRKGALSLTAMLQSHPAASSTASSSTESFTAASLLGSMSLSKTNFNTSLVQAQPNIILAQATANSANSASARMISLTSTAPPLISTARTTSSTNLLHTQLTKVLKKPDTQKMEIVDAEETKHETKEDSFIAEIKQEITSGCRSFNISTPVHMSRGEDSQNVLLKKLLQNTGCASTQSIIISSNPSVSATSSVFTTASTLDSQIAKVTPTLASLLPTVVKTEPGLTPPPSKPQTPIQKQTLMSRETSFVSNPVIQQLPTSSTGVVTSQPLHIDIKKCMPPSRTPSRDDLLSPQTPRSSCSQDSSLQTPPLIIKKEMNQTVPQSPILTPQEVKREFMDETSQHSEVSDHSRSEVQVKEENENMDSMTEKMILDQKEELKKQKRRLYQQKRRLNQQQSKEAQAPPKKRPRKSSKADEDYDAYVDGVLAQMRSLPPMNVTEPVLNRNFGVVPVFGIGDTSKLGTKEHDSRFGELNGTYGNAVVPGFLDYYETKPFGDLEKLPEIPPVSTQRGFYNLEFPPIKFDNEETKRFDLFCREDSPDIIEGSSCTEDRGRMPNSKLIGLKLICDDDEDEQELKNSTVSPAVTILAPTPIRLKSTSVSSAEESPEANKENIGGELCVKSKSEQGNTPQATPVKDPDNVTVTLTLTSSAAENIMGVLRDLANILHIPAPTSYQIVERSPTPPSQKLGLYRTKGKDGKEGAPIDIQSILNGAAKFCKHCDVVILCNMIKKKVSELPFLYKDSELMGDGDDLYFCSTSCYMQFALMNRSPLIAEDKAAAIIDHLCQKDKAEQRARNDPFDPKNLVIEKMTLGKELSRNEERALAMFARPFNSRRGDSMDTSKTTNTWKGIRYKSYSLGCLQPRSKYKKPTDKETMELLYKLGLTLTPPKGVEDTRRCMFCHVIGDGVADGPGRLLNYDVDKWVHLNCALWSEGVYETVNGALMNLDNALRQSTVSTCIHCLSLGATVRCFKTRCSSVYHLNCAVKDNCVFFKNKTTFCATHVPKNEKDNELTTLSVSRRVYVNRDENRQVANIMHNSDTNSILRVGSLIFLSVGQLLPHQLQNFHTPNFIYPIGYKIIRFYWSIRYVNKRCRYVCSINESFGIPEFSVLVQEPPEEDIEFKDTTPRAIWTRIVEKVSALRLENGYVKTFAKFVNGEDMFGLTEPAVVRVLESLPGIETLTDYKFKYGRNPLLELPLAINPTGSARSEARLRNQQHWKRHHTQRSGGSSLRPLFGPTPPGPTLSTFSEVACPYSKQFVHSKSSQYKKMKQEWRNNVYLARSKIQGLGLYAARDLEKHTMVIEYIGEIIRTELAETREKKYEARNRGIYMFRLDEERVVDATLSGGLARYINHSCNPNCVAETVEVDRDFKIIIFAKRRIQRGEELSYDYKFDIEDDQHKISCMCGAPNCRKWMN